MQSVEDFFLWLYEAHGINLTIFSDSWDRARFLAGILTTIELSVVCIVLSVVIGIVGVWLQGTRARAPRMAVAAYIAFFRGTPPLVQMYFFYFAVDRALSSLLGVSGGLVSNFGWAVISLSFFAGAFNVEIFRAGMSSVPGATIEAAEALAYTRFQIYRHVTLPLALRASLPALNSNLVNLVKTTTVAYAIAVPETLYVANQIWSDEYNVVEMMNVVWVTYLILVGILVWMMHAWEKNMRIPGYGAAR
ncbi:amino acid ABC transporter permease [Amaricoccus solimangrovi]|uniref:Amino acid ABC transporter permease n=1 Tax=Amaricoccus solimangrovi TaxID=2589815 RepID=A0A501WPD0_9RHOB|nr:amino acid ABC transporter permease [Amaricoccus solimangrovi]TPE51613.1 amino acid ABC transporter permease [Amaricoccus solimangrovi]